MTATPLSKILKAALIAGVIGALITAAFNALVTEPVIDQAIALEEQMSAAAGDAAHSEEIVTRDMQRVGLWIGFLMYGVSWSLLFGVIYFLAQRWLPGSNASWQGIVLALLAYWAIGLMPFLKYPANPPGVGDPATIGLRQNLYFGLLVIGIVGAGLSVLVYRYTHQSLGKTKSWLSVAGVILVLTVVLYLALPNNPDPILMPMDVVNNFRILSLIGLTLFWAALGASFARLVRPATPTTA